MQASFRGCFGGFSWLSYLIISFQCGRMNEAVMGVVNNVNDDDDDDDFNVLSFYSGKGVEWEEENSTQKC